MRGQYNTRCVFYANYADYLANNPAYEDVCRYVPRDAIVQYTGVGPGILGWITTAREALDAGGYTADGLIITWYADSAWVVDLPDLGIYGLLIVNAEAVANPIQGSYYRYTICPPYWL